jgi:hypothetical protein
MPAMLRNAQNIIISNENKDGKNNRALDQRAEFIATKIYLPELKVMI